MYRYIVYIFGCVICIGAMVFLWQQISLYQNIKDTKELYAQEKYQDIIETYGGTTNAQILHNLGNTSYELYKDDVSGDIQYLEQALRFFQVSLDIQEHEDTRYNYEFIKKLLEEIGSDSQNQKDSMDGENNQSSPSPSEEMEDTQGEEESQSIGSGEQELSEQQKEALKEATQRLKQDQKRYQQYLGKYPEGNNFNDFFDTFFGNIRGSEEKNW